MNLYGNTRALRGFTIKTPKEETVTIPADTWRAVQQIMSDFATTYKTDYETFDNGRDEALDQYEHIAFYAMTAAQKLNIPYNRNPNIDPDEDEN